MLETTLAFFAPELALLATAVIIMLRVILFPKACPSCDFRLGWLGFFASVAFAIVAIGGKADSLDDPLMQMLAGDTLGLISKLLIAGAGLIVMTHARPWFAEKRAMAPEIPFLFATSALGLMLMASSVNFLMMLVGLETASLGMYVLASSLKRERPSIEAGVKFFLNSAFATAILMWGISIIFGISGSLDFDTVRSSMLQFYNVEIKPFPMLAALAIILGLGFKITLFPFHLWAPDVYQGSPTPFTGFLATASKVAGVVVLIRVFAGPLHYIYQDLSGLMWILSALTMLAASATALWQVNAKRLLAYSSISHAGFVLMGIAALKGAGDDGLTASVFYLIPYMVATAGAFMVVSHIERVKGDTSLKAFNGLWKSDPGLAFAMVVFLASLAGLPPTLGFVGKFMLFASAYESGLRWLLASAVLSTVISLFFYFSIVRCMLFNAPEPSETPAPSRPLLPIVLIAAVFTLAAFSAQLVWYLPFVLVGLSLLLYYAPSEKTAEGAPPRNLMIFLALTLLFALFFTDGIVEFARTAVEGMGR